MAHRFTCGEKKICEKIEKSQNIMKLIVDHMFDRVLNRRLVFSHQAEQISTGIKLNRLQNYVKISEVN